MKQKSRVLLCFLASFLLAGLAHARNVEELGATVVTAQKVEEKAQEVPVSMTIFDEISIEDRRIESVEDMASFTSNFMLTNRGSNYYMPTIRGISQAIGYSISNPVSVLIDGVPVSSTLGFNEVFMDIERIEILKGPQSTLYGKETQAGVINVITKKPNNKVHARLRGDLGSDDKRQVSFSVSGPIVKDRLFIGLSAKHYEKDGFIKNTNLDGYENDKEHDYGRLNLRFTPNKNFEVSLTASRLELDNGGSEYAQTSDPDSDTISSDYSGNDKSSSTSFALKATYEKGNYLFESITTHREYKADAFHNYHFTSFSNFHVIRDSIHKKTSQEFRLSNNGNKFRWLVGLYADKDELDDDSIDVYSFGPDALDQVMDSKSLGAFIHTDYAVTGKLSLIMGARYDKDKSEFEDKNTNTKLEVSNNEISPKISLKYQQSKESMYYTTVAKGYRAGGFHPYAPNSYPKEYDREILWNYEIGAKNSFFNNRLIVNSSVFYMQIDDMQVKVSPEGASSAYVGNAAKATSKGFELELNGKLTKELEVFGSFGYTDAEFDEYKDSKGDYSGNNTVNSPEYNYNVGAQYRHAKGYFARVDVNGYGKTYFNQQNSESRDAYNLVNAKLGYEAENYDIYLYGENLFDKDYDAIGMFGPSSVVYSDPREVGVQLTYRF